MSQILHGTTNLIYLPGRTLSRLENGVVQISRTYACRTSGAATIRSFFDVGKEMPGESGITIKYNYSETERADGFTEFQVTGSGQDPSQPSTGESALKIQDNRTVQTYPSGLVRVERSYICPTKDEAKFRPTLEEGRVLPYDDGTPAIDGLYIFPTPNEIRRDDGFTEFRVTAYGRTNIFSEIAIQKSSSLGTYRNVGYGRNNQLRYDNNSPAINDLFIIRGILPSSEPTATIIRAPNIENPGVIDAITQRPLVPSDYLSPIYTTIIDGEPYAYREREIIRISIILDSYSSTNFGRWSEYIVTWRASGYVERSQVPA